MGVLVALTVGYFMGSKAGSRELAQLRESLLALCGTEEFTEVVAAARSHVGHTLRELATTIEGNPTDDARNRVWDDVSGVDDLVDRVRSIVGRGERRGER